MLLEVEIPAKTFVTDATSERLLFVVGVHVKGQVVDLQCKIRFRSRPFGFSPAYSTQSYSNVPNKHACTLFPAKFVS